MTSTIIAQLEDAISITNLEKALACAIQRSAARSNISPFMGLYKQFEERYQNMEISEKEYDRERIGLRKRLLFFVRQDSSEAQTAILRCIGANNTRTIVFVQSTPREAAPLHTEFEFKKVGDAIRAGGYASQFNIREMLLAASISDFVGALVQDMPQFVHFSGHAGQNGIVLSTEENEVQVLYTANLVEIMKTVKDYYARSGRNIELIFLNACHSESAIAAIAPYSTYCIGMKDFIPDDDAIAFSTHFYGMLANMAAPDIEACFTLALEIWNSTTGQKSDIPQLWKNGKKIPVDK